MPWSGDKFRRNLDGVFFHGCIMPIAGLIGIALLCGFVGLVLYFPGPMLSLTGILILAFIVWIMGQR